MHQGDEKCIHNINEKIWREETIWEAGLDTNVSEKGPVVGSFEHGNNEPSGSIKGG